MATDLPGRKKGYENSILNEEWVFHHLEILGMYEGRVGRSADCQRDSAENVLSQELLSGLLQQTINTLNKLLITLLRSFEQKNLLSKFMPLLIFGNISYFGHNSN